MAKKNPHPETAATEAPNPDTRPAASNAGAVTVSASAPGTEPVSLVPPLADDEDERPALWVRSVSPAGTRRRAGFTFGREPFGIDLEALTEEQIALLVSDPLLVVERATYPASALWDTVRALTQEPT